MSSLFLEEVLEEVLFQLVILLIALFISLLVLSIPILLIFIIWNVVEYVRYALRNALRGKPSRRVQVGDTIWFEFAPLCSTRGIITDVINTENERERRFIVYSSNHGEFTVSADNINSHNR